MRDLGGLLFIDIRDRGGVTQVVFDKDDEALMAKAKRLRSEFVVGVCGRVRRRSPETVNAKLETGEVEVVVRAADRCSTRRRRRRSRLPTIRPSPKTCA